MLSSSRFLSSQARSTEHGVDVSKTVTAITAGPTDLPDPLKQSPLPADSRKKEERALAILKKLDAHCVRFHSMLDQLNPVTNSVLHALNRQGLDDLSDIGINLNYAWLDDIVAALVNNVPFVEMETVGPYAAHHIDDKDQLQVSVANLPSDEKIGMLLVGVFRDVFSDCTNLRMVTLLDELNNFATHRPFTEQEQQDYIFEMTRILGDFGVLAPEDTPGKDFLLLWESRNERLIAELIERLQGSGNGSVEKSTDGSVTFYPTKAFIEKLALESANRNREFRSSGILLCRDGRPTCQALDAAGFLNPINQHIMHVIMLDKRFMGQQDKTYALIRALNIVTQERHHNIFYDSKLLEPELAVYVVCELLSRELRQLIRRLHFMDDWKQFDPEKYVVRNHLEQILFEDRDIIPFVTDCLTQLKITPKSLLKAANIGTGPNLYPAMLVAPYIHDEGSIELIEYGETNRNHLRNRITNDIQKHSWRGAQGWMTVCGGQRYRGSYSKVRSLATVVAGSIFALPKEEYELITSYFVSELITMSRYEFRLCIQALASAIKPDGTLIVAHTVRSARYSASHAAWLTEADIRQAYRDADLTCLLHRVSGSSDKTYDDHDMVVVIARKEK